MSTMKKTIRLVCLCALLTLLIIGLSACEDDDQPCEHAYGSWTVTVHPGCETTGIRVRECTKCGEIQTEIIDALGHNYVDGKCTICGEEE